MLFKRAVLERIAEGTVTLAFRHWRRPTVKPGGRLRTAVGELAIDSVEPVEEADIGAEDAVAAGYPSPRCPALRHSPARRRAALSRRLPPCGPGRAGGAARGGESLRRWGG